MVAPLEGIRVIDLSKGIAGAVATMVLADFGADVVKVEPPGGDPDRSQPGWATWQRGKHSVVIDQRAAADMSVLGEMLAGADVCVSSDVPEQAVNQAVLGSLASQARNPRLVVLRMPPYLGSAAAAWAGGIESNELLSAATGISMRQSSFDDGPVDPVYPHLVYEQGLWAVGCALAALVERERSGRGQEVTVSGFHGALVAGCATFLIDPTAQPSGPVGPGGANPCYTRYQCGDGRWLFLGALTPKFQLPAFETLGLADIPADPRIDGQLNRMVQPENRSWIRPRMASAFATRPREAWLKALDQAGVPAGPLMDRDGWLNHPQIRDIGMRLEVDDPERGRVVMPGIPLVLSSTPGAVRSAAPACGDVRAAELHWPATQQPREPAPTQAAGPLQGIRVLDLGTILAGPFAGYLLAELGADVIKVEPPGGDPFRQTGFIYNRGMRSIPVDLRTADGQDVFSDLARSADVVIDNYRPGVLQRLRIDYDSLTAVNPGIICLSITGFGEGGPLAMAPGFDPILQGMSGMMTAQGGSSEPVFLTVAVNDVTGGAMTVAGACLALYRRAADGHGQRGRTSLDALAAFMQSAELTQFDGRPAAKVGGRDYPGPAPLDRLYATRNGWVRLQARPSDLPALRQAGLLAGQSAADAELTRQLTSSFSGCDRDELVGRLAAAGVPAAAARSGPELVNDPDIVAAGLLQRHERASGNPYFVPGRLASFERTQQAAPLVAPGLGEHTREILAEVGYDASRIDQAIAAGTVTEGPPLNLETFGRLPITGTHGPGGRSRAHRCCPRGLLSQAVSRGRTAVIVA